MGDNNFEFWIAGVVMGCAGGLAAFSAGGYAQTLLARLEDDLTPKLRRLRLPTERLRTYLVVWFGVMAATFFLVGIVLESLILAALASVFLVCAPWYLIERIAEQRRRKIEEQMADAMFSLAGGVKAGLSLSQALEMLATQSPPPINDEFRQIVAEYHLGKPLDDTLNAAKERLGSENFVLFSAAMLASHESGGRLNETVERVAESTLELQRLERKVRSETAQARKSAVYMAMTPLLILVVYYFVDPENTVMLFTHVVGQCLLASAVILNAVAYFWARYILQAEI